MSRGHCGEVSSSEIPSTILNLSLAVTQFFPRVFRAGKTILERGCATLMLRTCFLNELVYRLEQEDFEAAGAGAVSAAFVIGYDTTPGGRLAEGALFCTEKA